MPDIIIDRSFGILTFKTIWKFNNSKPNETFRMSLIPDKGSQN